MKDIRIIEIELIDCLNCPFFKQANRTPLRKGNCKKQKTIQLEIQDLYIDCPLSKKQDTSNRTCRTCKHYKKGFDIRLDMNTEHCLEYDMDMTVDVENDGNFIGVEKFINDTTKNCWMSNESNN